MNAKKTPLKGKTVKELEEFVISLGEPKFRGKQIFQWVNNTRAKDFSEMLNLPKLFREKLAETATLEALSVVDRIQSPSEGTVKLLFKTAGGNVIESVIIPEEKRVTLCLSTQVGCPLDCQFCATGLMGYKKNLTPGEIVEQYHLANELNDRPITNIVYMGMGEPLLNYEATLRSLEIFSQEMTTGISHKKITVSTAGIVPRIYDLSGSGKKYKLALSLHSCFEDIRTKIMPINSKYSLKDNLKALKHYAELTDTRITFEYVMLKGVNDRDEDIQALAKVCRMMPSKVNIIPFNSLQHMNPSGYAAELIPSSSARIEEFATRLRDNYITVMVRNTQGSDIAAACGQLASPHYLK